MIEEKQFLELIQPVNLQIGTDGLTLYNWLKSHGILDRERNGLVQYGTRDQRLISCLYALANLVFGQAQPDDGKVFDLYDALVLELPHKHCAVSEEFLELHTQWRKAHPFDPLDRSGIPDMHSYKRVLEFVRQAR